MYANCGTIYILYIFKDICEKKFGSTIVRLLRKQIGKNHEMIKFKFSRCVVELGACVWQKKNEGQIQGWKEENLGN